MYTFKILLEIVKFLSKNIAVTMFGMLVPPFQYGALLHFQFFFFFLNLTGKNSISLFCHECVDL